MSVLAVLGSFVILSMLFALYVWLNDKKMKAPPPNNLGSEAWSKNLIQETYERVASKPRLFEGKLPPKTERRYIVVGGVSTAPQSHSCNSVLNMTTLYSF